MQGNIAAAKSPALARDAIRRAIGSFQLPLYVTIASAAYKGENIDAALYNLRETELTHYFREKDDASKTERGELCMKALGLIMAEITDPALPFIPDDSNSDYCAVCPFFYACR